MMEITQSTNPPASMEAGFLNSKWKRILFFFHKRVFLSKLEDILSAAAGHEGNSLPSGNCQYQVLAARADELCTEFAERWGDCRYHRRRGTTPGSQASACLPCHWPCSS